MIMAERFSHVVLNPPDRFLEAFAERLNVVFGQFNHVIAALSERWNIDLNYRQPVIKIEPEPASFTL